MKYIVVTHGTNDSEELFIFPQIISHVDMFDILKKRYSTSLKIISAGHVVNCREEFTLEDGSKSTFDQIRLSGGSFTLNVKSRPEDVELFNRRTNEY